MRRIRSRLTILLVLLVIFTSILSLTLSALTRNGVIFQRDNVRYLLFGYAFKDVVLLIVAVVLVLIFINLTSRSTTEPIRDLTRATREIAQGNYDVTVDAKDRVEELGELERNFNLMAAELRTNEYLRKDFISNVSHQLKTPLSILSGYAKLLEEGGITAEEQAEYSAVIAGESHRLVGLIDDMLRLSRIDHREIRPRSDVFPLGESLRRAVLQLEPRWSRAGLKMEADIQDVDFTGDEELLSQVWSNLLENAVKFTPAGGRIGVALRQDGDRVEVTVSDDGPGMDEATLSRIFEQFYQGDTPHRGEGSGLGLPLCRRIVELHGGTITAESRPGEGSCFRVILPGGEAA